MKGGHNDLDDVSAGVPVKSYGGISFASATATNQLQQPNYLTYHQQIQQPILPFPFYGFNFYQQPQQHPVRTYGGIVNSNPNPTTTTYQPTTNHGFGWFGAGFPQNNQDQGAAAVGNAAFPPLPNYAPFVVPQFTPQIFNPPPQQYPFPNINWVPYGINNNAVSFHPQPQQPNPIAPPPPPPPTIDFESSTELPTHEPATSTESTFIIHETTPPPTVESTTSDEFLTNSLFGGSNLNRQQWTVEDEKAWQATTKSPYFDNKVPGADCSLPAAAVLGEI